MEIGARLKNARLEAGLSQRQLCGDVITRNMLSLIENGSARPSMDTLTYLAGRLGKPVGYFLEEDAVLSPNQPVMAAARQAFAAGSYEPALSALKDYRKDDAVFDWEADLLLALSAMALAEEAVSLGKLPYGAALLEEARQAGARTPYFDRAQEKRWLFLQARLRPDVGDQICVDEVLILKAEAVLQQDPHRAAALLEAMDDHTAPRWQLLRGKTALALGEYGAAAEMLGRAEEGFPREAVPLLETCYRELGDFKRAYEYACKQRK